MNDTGNADRYLRKVREIAPVGGEVFKSALENVTNGMSFSYAGMLAGLDNSCLGYMAWLAAPDSAKAKRVENGRNVFHLKDEILTSDELVAFRELGRHHPRIRPFIEQADKEIEEAQGELKLDLYAGEVKSAFDEVRDRLVMLEKKVDTLLSRGS